MPSSGRPQIAIAVAVSGDAVLVNEAIRSALAQETERSFVVVAAGASSSEEARDALAGWRDLYPGRLHAVSSPKGGEAAARNCALEYALGVFPDMEAVFTLASADQLHPNAVDCFGAALDARPEIGWFYPSFELFGFNGPAVPAPAYNLLFHANRDLSQAGILLRRGLLESGLRYCESAPQRLANWDLSLRCARSGFPGAPLTAPVVRRRRRAHDLPSPFHPGEEGPPDWLRENHAWLYNPASAAALSAAHAPPYLTHFAGTGRAVCFTDPDRAEDLDADVLARRVYARLESPSCIQLPPVWIFADPQAWQALRASGLLRFALHDLGSRLEDENRASLSLVGDETGRFRYLDADRGTAETPERLALVAIPLSLVRTILTEDYGRDLVEALASEPTTPAAHRTIAIPGTVELGRDDALGALRTTLTALLESRYRHSPWLPGAGRKPGPAAMPDAGEIARHLSRDGRLPYPMLKDPTRPDVGFALPHFDFGGVEKVAAGVAQQVRSAGFRTHLLMIGGNPITPSDFAADAFDTLNWFPSAGVFNDVGPSYLGARTSGWKPDRRERADLLGLVSWLDVLINAQSGAMHGAMAELHSRGVVTVSYEHVIERSPYGRPYGPPQRLLAYERAYDLVATCSEDLSIWLHGQGVPAEKLVVVPNQPGYPMTLQQLQDLRGAREADRRGLPIRVLFLGRFDRQKGIDRLEEIVAALDNEGEFEFMVAGRAVIDGDSPPPAFPPSVRQLAPVYPGEPLTELYTWADVLLLPSRFEGLPLTILEAQRCGCAVIATDVGANREAILDGQTGFLVTDRNCVRETVHLLRALAADRTRLGRVSQAARQRQFSWSTATADLIGRLRSALDRRSSPGRDSVAASTGGLRI